MFKGKQDSDYSKKWAPSIHARTHARTHTHSCFNIRWLWCIIYHHLSGIANNEVILLYTSTVVPNGNSVRSVDKHKRGDVKMS